MAKFKENITKYTKAELSIPPPRIMLTGTRGCGLQTQLAKLNEKFNIPIFNMKDNFIKRIKDEKEKRK